MLHIRIDALEVHRIESDREHHDLHHAERGDEQPFERRALFGYLRTCGAFRRQGLRLVTEVCECRKVA